ncbi:MAG TPA: GNAT family N-acetyltransferase [Azonexus sp.]|nr:GNAT family N-acetyltransferase [Azonexus sp.]
MNSRTARPVAALPLVLRKGEAADAHAISHLLMAASVRHVLPDFSVAGQEYYSAQLMPARIEAKLRQPEVFRFHLATLDDELLGVAAIKEIAHLYYLFSDNQHRRRGIARALWQRVLDEAVAAGNPGEFNVNASRYAVAAYWRLGFLPLGPEAECNGIRYVPMAFNQLAAFSHASPSA